MMNLRTSLPVQSFVPTSRTLQGFGTPAAGTDDQIDQLRQLASELAQMAIQQERGQDDSPVDFTSAQPMTGGGQTAETDGGPQLMGMGHGPVVHDGAPPQQAEPEDPSAALVADGNGEAPTADQGKQAAITMAAYMRDTGKKLLSTDDITALQNDPSVSQQVRDSAKFFANNEGAKTAVDGERTGKLDDKVSVGDFEEFAKDGGSVNPTQVAALALTRYIHNNKTGDLNADKLNQILSDPNATDLEKQSASYMLQNKDGAFDQADGIRRKGKTDGYASGKDLTELAKASTVDSPDRATEVLKQYLTRNDDALHKFLHVLKEIGMALGAAALALIPGVGEIADAALIGGEVAGEVAGELAAQGARAGLRELGKQAGHDAADHVLGGADQGPVLDGGKGKNHPVNAAGLEKMMNDPGVPLSVRNACAQILADPDLLKELEAKHNGQSFDAKDLGAHNDQVETDLKDQESKIQVFA